MSLFYRPNDRRAHLFRQSVTIVGHGSPHFAAALSALQRIYKYFNQSFAADVVKSFGPFWFEDLPCIEASTRYLTPSRDNNFGQNISIPPNIDPNGYMKKHVQSSLYHFTEDNVVKYLEVIPDDDIE
jgi:hypothetical protein